CTRCQTVVYPGAPENHKKGYCPDSACQVKRKGDDDIPDWPPPQGVYAKGTFFHPIEFLKTLWDMYERVVVCEVRSADLPVEYEAFAPEKDKHR
ncbi:hypothetical protein BC827DRAFT_1146474, partial [Russula dissimulans]